MFALHAKSPEFNPPQLHERNLILIQKKYIYNKECLDPTFWLTSLDNEKIQCTKMSSSLPISIFIMKMRISTDHILLFILLLTPKNLSLKCSSIGSKKTIHFPLITNILPCGIYNCVILSIYESYVTLQLRSQSVALMTLSRWPSG